MTCIDQMTPTFDGSRPSAKSRPRRPLECRLANNCGPLANPKDSPAEAGLLTCLRGSNACALSSGSGATAPRSDRPIRLYEPTFEMKVD
jgi:hypothetical protein